jgi:hypothetical protein
MAGQAIPISGYRVVDDQTISVRSQTGPGYETWVDSVVESTSTIRVAAKYRAQGFDQQGAAEGQYVWLTIHLQAPLGDRDVIDAAEGARVPLVP